MEMRTSLMIAGFVGIAGSLFEQQIISTVALSFCVFSAHNSLSEKFGSIFSIVFVFLAPFMVGISTLLFGNFVTPIPRVFIVLGSFIGLGLISYFCGSRSRKITQAQIVLTTIPALVCGLVSLFSTSKLITFIAFGYDNFYHLAIFRNMSDRRVLLVGGGDNGLMELTNSGPLGAGAALTHIADVIGTNTLDIRQATQIFFVISMLVPVAILFFCQQIIQLLLANHRKWHVVWLVALVLLIGFPSHQWFSGFLHSNAGIVVVLAGIVCYLGIEQGYKRVVILAIVVMVLSFVYLLYLPIVVVLLLKVLYLEMPIKAVRNWRCSFGVTVLTLLVVSFPLVLFFRSYGGNHLFVAGGIEQIPQAPIALLLGYGMGLVYEATRHGINQRRRVLPHALILLVVFLDVLSIWRSGYISYYPTKFSILLLIPILVFVVSETSFQIQTNLLNSWEKVAHGGILALILSLLIWSGLNPDQFRSGDQGALRGVIAEMVKSERDSDRGKFILALQPQAELVDRPVLVEVEGMESEQMSRWVSSIGFRFSDATWADWTSVRTYYSIGEYEIAYKVASGDPLYSVSGKGVLIATDKAKMLSDLREIGPGIHGCLVNANFTLTCN